MKRNTRIRNVLIAALFSTAMGFGCFQVFANDLSSGDGLKARCQTIACRSRCGIPGGDLTPDGKNCLCCAAP